SQKVSNPFKIIFLNTKKPKPLDKDFGLKIQNDVTPLNENYK
ncbi:hypothetical protein UC3_03582, partial [Enterococcus phoeniculicola ATCC BAA-412]